MSYWQHWVRSSSYRGRFQQEVERSLLILKLLTYGMYSLSWCEYADSIQNLLEPSSLHIRFLCPKPSAEIGNGTTVTAGSETLLLPSTCFSRWGSGLKLRAYINFILKCAGKWQKDTAASRRNDTQIQLVHFPLMFSIDGETDLPETELGHFGGYLNSKPVRIGNAATGHLQLDIYGELMDAVYL